MVANHDDPAAARAASLAAELRVAIGQLKRRMQDRAAFGDLSASQVAVLGHLDRVGTATVTSLARDQGVRPQSMGATVAVLEAAGLVRGAPDPKDRRQTMLSLSPSCRARIGTARLAREDWLFRAIARSLSPAEQDQLAHALGLLRRLAGS